MYIDVGIGPPQMLPNAASFVPRFVICILLAGYASVGDVGTEISHFLLVLSFFPFVAPSLFRNCRCSSTTADLPPFVQLAKVTRYVAREMADTALLLALLCAVCAQPTLLHLGYSMPSAIVCLRVVVS